MAEMESVRMSFPGGRQVVATIGRHSILTDQPVEMGGEDAAASPYSLFLASIGACAGFFALTFCQRREIPIEGLEVEAHPHAEDGVLRSVEIRVTPPAGFPERYLGALARAVEQCSVKRAIQAQPTFTVRCEPATVPATA